MVVASNRFDVDGDWCQPTNEWTKWKKKGKFNATIQQQQKRSQTWSKRKWSYCTTTLWPLSNSSTIAFPFLNTHAKFNLAFDLIIITKKGSKKHTTEKQTCIIIRLLLQWVSLSLFFSLFLFKPFLVHFVAWPKSNFTKRSGFVCLHDPTSNLKLFALCNADLLLQAKPFMSNFLRIYMYIYVCVCAERCPRAYLFDTIMVRFFVPP